MATIGSIEAIVVTRILFVRLKYTSLQSKTPVSGSSCRRFKLALVHEILYRIEIEPHTFFPKQQWKSLRGRSDSDGKIGSTSLGSGLTTTKSPSCLESQVKYSVPTRKLSPISFSASHVLKFANSFRLGGLSLLRSVARQSAVSGWNVSSFNF